MIVVLVKLLLGLQDATNSLQVCSDSPLSTFLSLTALTRAPIGLQYGKQVRWFFVFLSFRMFFFGGGMIPKWLISIPGHIALFFTTFLELPTTRPNMDPRALYLLQNDFNTYEKMIETFYNNIPFVNIVNMGVWNVVIVWKPAYRQFLKITN